MTSFVEQINKEDVRQLTINLIEACSEVVKYVEITRVEDILVIDFYKEECLATIAFSDYSCQVTHLHDVEIMEYVSAIFECYSEFMSTTFSEYDIRLKNI